MKRNAKRLWKCLVSEAGHEAVIPRDDDVSRIAAHLRWKPSAAGVPTWEEALWPLLLRFALPGAAILLLFASLLPPPKPAIPVDNIDELISATLPNS